MEPYEIERLLKLPRISLDGMVSLEMVKCFDSQVEHLLVEPGNKEALIVGSILDGNDTQEMCASDLANVMRETIRVLEKVGYTFFILARGMIYTPGIILMTGIPTSRRITTCDTQFELDERYLYSFEPLLISSLELTEEELVALFEEDNDPSRKEGKRRITFYGERAHQLRIVRHLIK